MVDVRIGRCALTVRRREGWAWGDGRQALVDAALAGVEAAIEAAVADAGVDPDADIELDAPVRLEVGRNGVVTMASAAALVERLQAMQPSGSNAGHDLPARAPDSLERAAGPPDSPSEGPPGDGETPPAPGAGTSHADAQDRSAGGAAAAQAGDDAAVLRLVSASAAPGPVPDQGDAGHNGTARGAGVLANGPRPLIDEVTAGALARTLSRWSRAGQMARVVGAWQPELVRAWIEAIAAAAAHDGRGGPGPTAPMSANAVDLIAEAILAADSTGPAGRDAHDRLIILLAAMTAALGDRLPDGRTQALARARAGLAEAAPPPTAGRAPEPEPAAPSVSTRWPLAAREYIVAALPFLVIAELSRLGYVDAVVGATATTQLPSCAGAVGAVLATKALPAPGPAGRREDADAVALALASGAGAEELEILLAELAEHERELLAPLAGALQAAYAEGRSIHDELLVWSGDEGFVCGEEVGLLPAAWVADEGELAAALAALGDPPVQRGDGFGPLARALHDRAAIPAAAALDRHLAVAAATAMGLLAITLWGEDGHATSPLTTLDRLGDLDARVRRQEDCLLVSIPLGQRCMDLQRAGMLELFDIPWLPSGRLEIGTW